MPRKDPEARREYHREYIRKWYARDKALQKKVVSVKIQYGGATNWPNLSMSSSGGRVPTFGGDFPPYLMDFDHVTGEKLDNICGMRMRTVSREAIRAEIDKCEVVCATCHRERTHARRLGIQVQAGEFVTAFGGKYVSVLVYTRPVAGGGIEPPTLPVQA